MTDRIPDSPPHDTVNLVNHLQRHHHEWLADERRLLEGPRSRTAETIRLLRIMREFIRGFRALHFVGPCVTVFGSARFTELHPHYQLGREIGEAIARLGFAVITGGGP